MSEKNKQAQELKAYSKEEIIEALLSCWRFDIIVPDLLAILKDKRITNLIAKNNDDSTKFISASTAYCKWLERMCITYGNGKNVEMSDIPMEELKHGAELGKAADIAMENEKKSRKRVDKACGISKKGEE